MDGGEQGGGQSVGVSGSSEVTALVRGPSTIADRGFPLVEAFGEIGAAVGVGLSELSGECGKGAATLASGWTLELDEEPAPARLSRLWDTL